MGSSIPVPGVWHQRCHRSPLQAPIGSAGQAPRRRRPKPFDYGDLRLHPVALSADEVDRYYRGFANAILWPLFHGRLRKVELNRAWWHSYRIVNRRFADRCRTDRPARRHGVGARLPPAARPGDDPREASRPAHRPVPAHPVPQRAAVLDAAVAQGSHQGHARRRRARASRSPRMSPTSLPPPSDWSAPRIRGHTLFDGVHVGRCRCVPDLRRLRPLGRARREGRGTSRAPSRRISASIRSSSASTGSTTPRASRNGCGRSVSCSTRVARHREVHVRAGRGAEPCRRRRATKTSAKRSRR